MVDDFSELYFDQFLCMNHTRTVIDEMKLYKPS